MPGLSRTRGTLPLYYAIVEEDDRRLDERARQAAPRCDSLHRVLDLAGLDLGNSLSENRERLDMLQVVRLALQHIVLMAA